MDEKSALQPIPQTEEGKLKFREPVGVITMGKEDPRNLTTEQFLSSPDLLFHGCKSQIKFSQGFNYSSQEYLADNDGSQTLGEGFYTTDDKPSANNYSLVRQFKKVEAPIVIELLPFQAKILDLRDKTNTNRNAHVPREFFEKWLAHFKDYYFHNPERKNYPWYIVESESSYWSYLGRLMKLPNIELRAMLGTGPSLDREVGSLNYPSPPWMKRFANFMNSEGYDGLAYIEGGEGKEKKDSTTYVFFNLSKIGTFESWQETKAN